MTRVQWLIAALIALLVGAVTVAGLQWHRADSLGQQRSTRESAAQVASDVGEALFTYDYRHLDVTERRLASLATAGFAAQQAAHNNALQQGLVKAHATGSASVQIVSVSDIHASTADAFVMVDSQATATAGTTKSQNYLHMAMQKVDGHWKVAAVQTLTAPSR